MGTLRLISKHKHIFICGIKVMLCCSCLHKNESIISHIVLRELHHSLCLALIWNPHIADKGKEQLISGQQFINKGQSDLEQRHLYLLLYAAGNAGKYLINNNLIVKITITDTILVDKWLDSYVPFSRWLNEWWLIIVHWCFTKTYILNEMVPLNTLLLTCFHTKSSIHCFNCGVIAILIFWEVNKNALRKLFVFVSKWLLVNILYDWERCHVQIDPYNHRG